MVNPTFTVLSFANMVYPTPTMLVFATIAAAVLLAADWLVWGRAYATDFRAPQTVMPQSDVIERLLARFTAINEARLPRTAAIPATASAASVSVEDDGHGFRKVA